jgi:hypothetical protein
VEIGGGRRWEEVGGGGRRWEEVGGGGRRWEEVGGGGRPRGSTATHRQAISATARKLWAGIR